MHHHGHLANKDVKMEWLPKTALPRGFVRSFSLVLLLTPHVGRPW